MASGDPLGFWNPAAHNFTDWYYATFTSGGVTAPAKGDTIRGDTSGATWVIELVVLTGGSWAGGDAAGFFLLSNWNGTVFTSTENFSFNATGANHGTFGASVPSAFAQPSVIRGDTPVLDFDATSNEVAVFDGFLPSYYGGGNLTLTVGVVSTVTTGHMSFGAMFKRGQNDVGNFGVVGNNPSGLKAYAAPKYNTAVTPANVAGEIAYFTITFTQAEADAIAAGEFFQMALFRDARDSVNDDMAADARVAFLALAEA